MMIRTQEAENEDVELEPIKRKKPQGGIKDVADGKSDVFKVDPRLIKVKEGWNSRDPNDPLNAEHIETLALSIAEYGVQNPLTVFWEDNHPVVVDGHCRLAACMLAISRGATDLKTVPVIVTPRHHSEVDRIFAQIVKNMGKQLAPIEAGRVYARLLNLGAKEKDIAGKAGITVHRLQELIRLNAADAPITDLVTRRKISADLATKTIRAHKGDQGAATKTLQSAVQKAEAEGRTKATFKDLAPVSDPEREPQMDLIADAAVSGEKRELASAAVPALHPAYMQALKDVLELAQRLKEEGEAEYREGGIKMVQILEDKIAGRTPRVDGEYDYGRALGDFPPERSTSTDEETRDTSEVHEAEPEEPHASAH